jgi:hypothetical protein
VKARAALLAAALAMCAACAGGPSPSSSAAPAATATPAPRPTPAPASAPTSAVSPVEPDGRSVERAVPVPETSEAASLEFQRRWLAAHFARYRKVTSGVEAIGGRFYEEVTIGLPDGTEVTLFFDISDSYAR